GTGMVHPAQISLQGSGSDLDADKVDGKDLGQSGSNYIPYANSSGNVLIDTTTDNGIDKLQVNGLYLQVILMLQKYMPKIFQCHKI
ncbi:MAG: hypothetical protein IE909_18640, partial [Campylobacterales bacterium]|nr:hypothetical protein [Campylobacterales bacterium]